MVLENKLEHIGVKTTNGRFSSYIKPIKDFLYIEFVPKWLKERSKRKADFDLFKETLRLSSKSIVGIVSAFIGYSYINNVVLGTTGAYLVVDMFYNLFMQKQHYIDGTYNIPTIGDLREGKAIYNKPPATLIVDICGIPGILISKFYKKKRGN